MSYKLKVTQNADSEILSDEDISKKVEVLVKNWERPKTGVSRSSKRARGGNW